MAFPGKFWQKDHTYPCLTGPKRLFVLGCFQRIRHKYWDKLWQKEWVEKTVVCYFRNHAYSTTYLFRYQMLMEQLGAKSDRGSKGGFFEWSREKRSYCKCSKEQKWSINKGCFFSVEWRKGRFFEWSEDPAKRISEWSMSKVHFLECLKK